MRDNMCKLQRGFKAVGLLQPIAVGRLAVARMRHEVEQRGLFFDADCHPCYTADVLPRGSDCSDSAAKLDIDMASLVIVMQNGRGTPT